MKSASYFAKSHGFVIGSDGNFATVRGNQIVNYFNREPERKGALTVYDQFRQVMLGDIYRTQNFGVYKYPRQCGGGREAKTMKTICAAQIVGVEGKAFTVISYTGPESQEAFEQDFRIYSRTLTAGPFQVYGINTSVPTILFYDERQPLANFLDGLGLLGKFYLQSLKKQFNWRKNEIWLDPRKGVLCRGPAGPECYTIASDYIGWEYLPCSADLLQDGNCLRFLASLKSRDVDRSVVDVIAEDYSLGVSQVKVYRPTISSTLTNATVAVGSGLWERDMSSCLCEREVMEAGAIRFKLEDKGEWLQSLWINWEEERRVWTSQASSIFHQCGVALDDDLSRYELIRPYPCLSGYLSNSGTTRQRRREQAIYLFVRATSTFRDCTTSSLHYWSFEPTGRHPLTPEMCKELGLPIKLSVKVFSADRYRWNNEHYKLMHQYQLARGFNPETTDFARHLGYRIYQVQGRSSRFAGLGLAKGALKSFWFEWSWAASEETDIPAFGL